VADTSHPGAAARAAGCGAFRSAGPAGLDPNCERRPAPGVLGTESPGRGRHLSQPGLEFIARREGIDGEREGRYYPYPDIYGNPTVGYGHLLKKGEDFSQGLTAAQALALLRADAQAAETFVRQRLATAVPQNEFDALVDVAFNSERAALALIRKIDESGVVRRADFVNTLPHGAGSPRGLVRRREKEATLFLEGDYR
jgi:lysozyme